MRAVDLNVVEFLRFGLQPWPLVVVIEDCNVSELVPLVLEVAREHDEQVCELTWKLAGMRADQAIGELGLN